MQNTELQLQYCRGGGKLPPYNVPVLCLFQQYLQEPHAGKFRVCTYIAIPVEDKVIGRWILHNSIGLQEVNPLAWLDTEDTTLCPEYYIALSKLGKLSFSLRL